MPIRKFQHDGHSVLAEVNKLEDDVTFSLNRYLSDAAREQGRYDEGMAQYVALVRSVARLKVDDKTYSLKKGKGVPRYYDGELNKTLLEHLLGYVVQENQFLVQEERYVEAFEEYVLRSDKDQEDEDDPFEDGSGVDVGVNPTPSPTPAQTPIHLKEAQG